MKPRYFTPLPWVVGFLACIAPTTIAATPPGAAGSNPITKEVATERLKRHPIVKAAISQAEKFAGRKSCVMDFQKLRVLPQFEPGSAFEYNVRITCESKRGEFESAAIIEIEGQSLNYGDPFQDIDRLSFHIAG